MLDKFIKLTKAEMEQEDIAHIEKLVESEQRENRNISTACVVTATWAVLFLPDKAFTVAYFTIPP